MQVWLPGVNGLSMKIFSVQLFQLVILNENYGIMENPNFVFQINYLQTAFHYQSLSLSFVSVVLHVREYTCEIWRKRKIFFLYRIVTFN